MYKVVWPTLLEASSGNLLGEISEGLDEDIKAVIMPFKVQRETASNWYVGREGEECKQWSTVTWQMWSLTLFILLVKKNENRSQMTGGGQLRFAGWVVVNHIIDGFKEDPGLCFCKLLLEKWEDLASSTAFFDKWTSVLWLSQSLCAMCPFFFHFLSACRRFYLFLVV